MNMDDQPSHEMPEPSSRTSRESVWAQPVSRLKATDISPEAVNLNVEGRKLTNPIRGFGPLWQKTYQIRLSGAPVTPAQVIAVWKEKFPEFWPKGNHFYGSNPGIVPGEVAVLHLAGPGGINPPGAPLISTGIMVVFADDESFAFMNPEGHMFTSIITFSAFEQENCTVAQIQMLIRTSDPLYELTFRLGFGHKMEDDFWKQTLHSLAAYHNVNNDAQLSVVCLDPKIQWSEAKNIWKNAAIRTTFYTMLTPFRWVGARLGIKH